jgi:hypothetical protein
MIEKKDLFLFGLGDVVRVESQNLTGVVTCRGDHNYFKMYTVALQVSDPGFNPADSDGANVNEGDMTLLKAFSPVDWPLAGKVVKISDGDSMAGGHTMADNTRSKRFMVDLGTQLRSLELGVEGRVTARFDFLFGTDVYRLSGPEITESLRQKYVDVFLESCAPVDGSLECWEFE